MEKIKVIIKEKSNVQIEPISDNEKEEILKLLEEAMSNKPAGKLVIKKEGDTVELEFIPYDKL